MYTSLDYMADIPSFDFYKSPKKKKKKKKYSSQLQNTSIQNRVQ